LNKKQDVNQEGQESQHQRARGSNSNRIGHLSILPLGSATSTKEGK
jgi:hypothetical protein